MFVMGNLLIAAAKVVNMILNLVFWLIFIRALISWVNPDPYNSIVQFLYRTTEPILEPIRRFLPRLPLDFSPVIVILVIIFLQTFLVQSLQDMGYRMRVQNTSTILEPVKESSTPLDSDARPAPTADSMFR